MDAALCCQDTFSGRSSGPGTLRLNATNSYVASTVSDLPRSRASCRRVWRPTFLGALFFIGLYVCVVYLFVSMCCLCLIVFVMLMCVCSCSLRHYIRLRTSGASDSHVHNARITPRRRGVTALPRHPRLEAWLIISCRRQAVVASMCVVMWTLLVSRYVRTFDKIVQRGQYWQQPPTTAGYYIVLYYVVSYHIISYHVILYHIMSLVVILLSVT